MRSTLRRRVAFAAALAFGIGGGIFGVGYTVLRYTAPATSDSVKATLYPPFVEGEWIKVPVDITRDRDCLSQSTLTLRREHDYGPVLGGIREDILVIGLANTTLTPKGTTAAMLWFHRPPGVGGEWFWDGTAQDDCSNYLDAASRHPRKSPPRAAINLSEARP